MCRRGIVFSFLGFVAAFGFLASPNLCGAQNQVQAPSFSPVGGNYSSSQSVTISDGTSGTTIYYTTDGSTPTTSSAVYSAPITLSTSQTLSAIAVASGYSNSQVQSATYTFNGISAPNFVQQCNGYTGYGNTLSCTLAGVGAGNLLMIGIYGPASPDSVTSSVGTPTGIVSDGFSSNAYILTNTASGTITITANVSNAQAMWLSVAEYTNMDASPIDTASIGEESSYTDYLGTYPFQTSADGDLLWSFCANQWDDPISPGNGPITWNGITFPVGSNNGLFLEDGVAGPAGTYYGRCDGPGLLSIITVALFSKSNTPRAATPTFSPAAGAYVENQTVSISSTTPSATIYYTTDGSTPTTSSSVYTGSLTVGVSETVKAIAVASGYSASTVGSALYTIGSYPAYMQQCRSTAFGESLSCTLSGVKAGDALMIGITSGTAITGVTSSSGTPISVVNDGNGSYAYLLPNSVAGNVTVNVAIDGDDTIRLYVADYTNVAASPLDGSAVGTLTSYGTTISSSTFSTTNGSDMLWSQCWGPTWSTLSPGTQPITWRQLAAPESEINYIMVEDGLAGPAGDYYGQCNGDGVSSIITVALKSSASSAATPTFSPAAGNYASTQTVTISTTTPSATIYYTTDGTTPNASSNIYSGPLTVTGIETIQAIATANDNTLSSVASANYSIGYLPAYVQQCSNYQASATSISCTLNGVGAGDALLIAFHGPTSLSSVTSSSGTVTQVISDGEEGNVYLLANATAGTITITGHMSSAACIWMSVLEYTNVAFSPLDASAIADCGVTCSTLNSANISTTANSDILWSFCSNPDGTTMTPGTAPIAWTAIPTTSGPEFTLFMENGIAGQAGTYYGQCKEGEDILTVALKRGGSPIADTPTFGPAGGSYNSIQSVIISSTTPSATIYYTTDGTTPTTSSAVYSAPITVAASETIQAFATAAGYGDSAVGVANYTISAPIAVSLNPASVSLYGGQTQQFTATVTNSGNTAVTWTISPSGVGAIDSSGLYTAPASNASQQTVTVTATSQADNTKSASAIMTLLPPCASNGYSYLRSIVINHTKVPDSDQVNFPLLVSITDPTLKSTSNGGHVTNSAGDDIIFTSDPEGLTKLDYELEKYDSTTGQIIAWVRIPSLSHSVDTTLYMLYGNSSVSASQQNPNGVWASNFVAVWHLPNGTTLSATDSTANGNTGTPGSGAGATVGEVDGAASLDGTANADIALPSSSSAWNFANDVTVSAWIKTTDNGKGIFGLQNSNPLVYLEVGSTTAGGSANKAVAYFRTDNGSVLVASGSITVNDGSWHLIDAVRNTGSSIQIYVDGVLDTTTSYTDSGPIDASGDAANLGGFGGVYNSSGSLDEVWTCPHF